MGMKTAGNPWLMVATDSDRLDWNGIKARVDLARVATALLGPAARKQGSRLYWSCPSHQDRHPSFEVDTRRKAWRCWPCDVGGDAVELVKRVEKLTNFPEAARRVAELSGIILPSE